MVPWTLGIVPEVDGTLDGRYTVAGQDHVAQGPPDIRSANALHELNKLANTGLKNRNFCFFAFFKAYFNFNSLEDDCMKNNNA